MGEVRYDQSAQHWLPDCSIARSLDMSLYRSPYRPLTCLGPLVWVGWSSFPFVSFSWIILHYFEAFQAIRGWNWLNLVFVIDCIEINPKYGLGIDFWFFGVSKILVDHNSHVWNDFASISPPHSGPWSPSKVSVLYFKIFKTLNTHKNHVIGF